MIDIVPSTNDFHLGPPPLWSFAIVVCTLIAGGGTGWGCVSGLGVCEQQDVHPIRLAFDSSIATLVHIKPLQCPSGLMSGLRVKYLESTQVPSMQGEARDLYDFALVCGSWWTGWSGLWFRARTPWLFGDPIEHTRTECPLAADGERGSVTGLEVTRGRRELSNRDTYDFRLQCSGAWQASVGVVAPGQQRETIAATCPSGEGVSGLRIYREFAEQLRDGAYGEVDLYEFELLCEPIAINRASALHGGRPGLVLLGSPLSISLAAACAGASLVLLLAGVAQLLDELFRPSPPAELMTPRKGLKLLGLGLLCLLDQLGDLVAIAIFYERLQWKYFSASLGVLALAALGGAALGGLASGPRDGHLAAKDDASPLRRCHEAEPAAVARGVAVGLVGLLPLVEGARDVRDGRESVHSGRIKLLQAVGSSAPQCLLQAVYLLSTYGWLGRGAWAHSRPVVLSAALSLASLSTQLASFPTCAAGRRSLDVRAECRGRKTLLVALGLYFGADLLLRALAAGLLGGALYGALGGGAGGDAASSLARGLAGAYLLANGALAVGCAATPAGALAGAVGGPLCAVLPLIDWGERRGDPEAGAFRQRLYAKGELLLSTGACVAVGLGALHPDALLPAGWLPSAPHLEPAMVGAASAVVAALASVKLTAFAFYVFPATLGERGPHEAGYACELLGLG